MNIICLLFLSLASIFPQFANAKSLPEDMSFDSHVHGSTISSCRKDLEELRFCVIPQILSDDETRTLYVRVWDEFIEKAWADCKMDHRSNWKNTFPIHNKRGMFAGPAGQLQVMWDIRQDPRIVDIFAQIWNTDDLIVSMDGMSFMCPPEIREGHIETWMHVDQSILCRQDGTRHSNNAPVNFISESSLQTQPYTIQGQFLFEDSFEDDGGFYCIPKSHRRFAEFAPKLARISEIRDGMERTKARTEFFKKFFTENRDELGNSYKMQHVKAPRGSLILWDSRTVHWNQHANKNRSSDDSPKVRMVGYLCYVPKSRLTNEGRKLRKEAFERGVATGHNPARPELKYTKDHIWQEFNHYLESTEYVQPNIQLTTLGKSLLGIDELEGCE